tara:strand:+ start:36 stop:287 length:252 start_codon:yes stop_codon:yes gene_type:complete
MAKYMDDIARNMIDLIKVKESIDSIHFRISQIEIALTHLMFVVANQEKELPKFKNNIAKAEEMASADLDTLLSILSNKEKAEA